ncbi:hypothetical protein ACO22_05615 [Paracoccidioides brasiliensis]|uniref:Uncharacterized protein n=1 Tax=Paracoccidioides brasiliensis TaxID=121759 RepID=A0A1D2J9S9_PARBR|nr:hypothetical protein ACO22_05615 [Paracoccidioides brasiliensis]
MAESEQNQLTSIPAVIPAPASPVLHCYHTFPPHANHTCYHPANCDYDNGSLPPLLFQLDPPNQRPTSPIPNMIENGQEVKDYDGAVIRAFPFLPRYISARPMGWQLEYWMRLDSRLTYRDIKARMTVAKAILPSDNSLNMRREREARAPLGLSCWTNRRGGVTRTEIERVDKLSQDQVSFNTTMDVVYFDQPINGRRAEPMCLRAKNLADAPPIYYQCDYFLVDQQFHIPSTRLAEALAVHGQLLEKVANSKFDDWRQLPLEMLPPSWFRETRGERRGDAPEPSNYPPETEAQQTQGMGEQDNSNLVGSNDLQQHDSNQRVGPPRLLSPFQESAVQGTTAQSDQTTWADQANISSSFNSSNNSRGGMGFGDLEISTAPGFPSNSVTPGTGYRCGSKNNGLPSLGTEVGSTDHFNSQANLPASWNQNTYHPGHGQRLHQPFPTTAISLLSYNLHATGLINQQQEQQQQQQQQWPPSMMHTTLSSTQFLSNPSTTPQQVLRSSQIPFEQNTPGQNIPSTRDNPSTLINQRQTDEGFHRFNGSGPFSIRQNPNHRLNTDTDVIMQRNNSFDCLGEDNPQFSSFEEFLQSEM